MTDARVIRSAPWLAALVAGALCPAGCGGDASTAPSHTYTKIADMEGSGRLIQWTPPPGATAGGWFTATDCTQYDRISPPPYDLDPDGWFYAALPAPQETMPGTVSTHATRLWTTPSLVGVWGANVGFAFAGPADPDAAVSTEGGVTTGDAGACANPSSLYPNQAADLTAYTGVTFWARAELRGGRTMRVQVNDANTDPRGGICQDKVTTASDYCYNGFGVQVLLTETFQQYTLPFSQFVQRSGWGYHPDGIDWSRIYSMAFEIDLPGCTASTTTMCAGGAPTLSFDLWIDDVYFVNK